MNKSKPGFTHRKNRRTGKKRRTEILTGEEKTKPEASVFEVTAEASVLATFTVASEKPAWIGPPSARARAEAGPLNSTATRCRSRAPAPGGVVEGEEADLLKSVAARSRSRRPVARRGTVGEAGSFPSTVARSSDGSPLPGTVRAEAEDGPRRRRRRR